MVLFTFILILMFLFLLNYFCKAWWYDATKRRKFFENFARMNGFDPLVADNWYTITRDRVSALKVKLFFFSETIFVKKYTSVKK